jgi:anti-anti-sigma factor
MKVKIDTKEKFYVITMLEGDLTANLTEAMQQDLLPYLQKEVKNVVLNLKNVLTIDESAAETLAGIQQTFYEQSASFVICELQPQVEEKLDEYQLLEMLNATPSESEAWDMVQMEEIERDLLGGEPFD